MLQFGSINSNNILLLSSIDSTNTYAHQLLAQQNNLHSTVIQALQQTNGRGQRGNNWQSEPNSNLLMSIIIDHQGSDLYSQFILNMAICLAIAEGTFRFLNEKKCTVKWSNDIYIDDEKVAGVLIENVIRGSQWAQSIIGIGINVNTEFFDSSLKNPTSIAKQLGEKIDMNVYRNELISCINEYLQWAKQDEEGVLKKYNDMLYKVGEKQMFLVADKMEEYKILEVQANGQIVLGNATEQKSFSFGSAKQIIGSLN
jgi:BirA family transcriptional regulator, biotin operon repressor / biotin---[acetyl-CoA-carboxylase] ligase